MVVTTKNPGFLKSYKLCVLVLAVLTASYLHNYVLYDFSELADDLTNRVLRRRRNKNKAPKGKRKVIIWLLGYPKSGTDEIMNLVEHATEQSMGTNYGDVVQTKDFVSHVKKYPSVSIQEAHYDTGPYKNNLDYPAETENILVKTHCTGYCMDCDRINYIRNSMTLKRWWQTCPKSTNWDRKKKNERKGDKPYNKNSIRRAVIAIRNPLDIVQARFKEDAMEKGIPYKTSGLHDWCAALTKKRKGVKEIKNFLKNPFLRKTGFDFNSVPCLPEFLRIYWWYENVLDMTAKRHSTHIVMYETMKRSVRATAQGILAFSNLAKSPTGGFIFTGSSDASLWTEDDAAKIGAFMTLIGKGRSRSFDELFVKYF